MTYQPISVNADEAQMLESREFNQADVAHWLNLNPSQLGLKGYTQYSNFEDLHNIYNINWMEYYKSKAVGVNYYLEWHKHRKIKAYSLDSLIQISKEFRDTKIIFDYRSDWC